MTEKYRLILRGVVLAYLVLGALAVASLVGRVLAARRFGPRPGGIEPSSLGRRLYAEGRLLAWPRLAGTVAAAVIVLGGGAALAARAGAGGAAWLLGTLAVVAAVFAATAALSPQPGYQIHEGGVRVGRFGPRGRPQLVDIVAPFAAMVDVEVVRGAAACHELQERMRADAPRLASGGRMRVLGDLYAPGLGSALHIWLRPAAVPQVPVRAVPGRGRRTTLSVYWSGPEVLVGVRHPERLAAVLGSLYPDAPLPSPPG